MAHLMSAHEPVAGALRYRHRRGGDALDAGHYAGYRRLRPDRGQCGRQRRDEQPRSRSTSSRTDALDALGNTTAATGKGFAIGSAALTALALLASYIEEIKIGLLHIGQTAITLPDGAERLVQEASIVDFMEFYQINLMNPLVLVGVFIGAMMSFLFCGLTMNAVGRAAESMVEEVRRQFREMKGILTGEATPDYARCVAISTRGAQREMLLPSLLAIVVPVAVGLLSAWRASWALLVGGLSSGFVLAVFMANSGGAWDNAQEVDRGGQLRR